MIDSFMIGVGIGIALIPVWYAVVYVIDKLWDAFASRNEG